MRTIKLAFLLLAACWSTLSASSIQVNLANPSQTGAPGSVLQFFGTITNLSGVDPVYLNGISANSVSPDLTIDVIPFFFNRPASLAPGATSALFEIFEVTILPGALPGPHVGNTVSFQGGLAGGAFEALADANVDVSIGVSSIPEPSTALLLCSGCLLLGLLRRKR
ncbi:PEP-CTERM sorting domain-containing protein [Paludibaculum fermentans]|uniref:PEP-CTERM sorting domain-containing protein n=1 Tax=Paludibaculum fermentans TaxID=1473598 RepID=A0A7S7SK41_PALFE|nr:PEP-CTERM sorting domain-containing protein [Paludibaculum fermentans]QOY87909.1 PEP-CTERM sorting domain-containing protein [Paludibaculum fermentans]